MNKINIRKRKTLKRQKRIKFIKRWNKSISYERNNDKKILKTINKDFISKKIDNFIVYYKNYKKSKYVVTWGGAIMEKECINDLKVGDTVRVRFYSMIRKSNDTDKSFINEYLRNKKYNDAKYFKIIKIKNDNIYGILQDIYPSYDTEEFEKLYDNKDMIFMLSKHCVFEIPYWTKNTRKINEKYETEFGFSITGGGIP